MENGKVENKTVEKISYSLFSYFVEDIEVQEKGYLLARDFDDAFSKVDGEWDEVILIELISKDDLEVVLLSGTHASDMVDWDMDGHVNLEMNRRIYKCGKIVNSDGINYSK